MTVVTATTTATACMATPDLFLHPLLEEPLPAGVTSDTRRRHSQLTTQAEAACVKCPLLAECLYTAVVQHDVNGFVAGTTQRQRKDIRSALRITVEPEDFDTLAGVSARNRQVDHAEVLRLRNANPHESLEMIAQRLGCSLSTVKRHLRKARQGFGASELTMLAPSKEQVMRAYADVVVGRNRPKAA